MKSVAFNHFPRVVAGRGRFFLFNPILKKRYKNRPEERVRLSWVEFLLHQTNWKKSRIGFEAPVKVPQKKNYLRADVILYSKNMEPSVLIECKSSSVKLTESSAAQAARYNSEKSAKHIVLTNGIEDYWFEIKKNSARSVDNIFDILTTIGEIERDEKYWTKRGFCAARLSPNMKNWLLPALNTFWFEEKKGRKQFLDFQKSVLNVPMNQYYKIFDVDEGIRLAVTFTGYGNSDNYLLAILNVKNANNGLLVVNLDQYEQGNRESIRLIKENGRETNLTNRNLRFDFDSFYPAQIENMDQHLIKFFD